MEVEWIICVRIFVEFCVERFEGIIYIYFGNLYEEGRLKYICYRELVKKCRSLFLVIVKGIILRCFIYFLKSYCVLSRFFSK